MNGWKTMPLAEACEKITDGTHHSPPIQPSGVPYVTAKHIKEDGLDFFSDPWFVSEDDHRAIFARCGPRPGDVLYIKDGATTGIAAVNRYAFEFTMLSSVALLRPRVATLTPEFLCHWLNAPIVKRRILGGMAGVAIRRLTLEKINAIRIPLPPVSEQRRIAEILDKADALRARRRAALAQLDTLTQSIFLDMFGDPATNPKRWPRRSLLAFLRDSEVFVDGDWVESKDQDPNGEVRLIQLADIGDGTYLNKSSRFLTKATAQRLKCTPLRVGDVLVARMPEPLGRACIFPGDIKEAVTVVDVCIVRPRNGRPNPVWLMCCLNTPGFRGQIAREATGTTRERISRGNLSKLQIIAPPADLQDEFALRVDRLRPMQSRMAAATVACDQLFASLQHRAFREEL
jgi:type I restriction enzyme S subunit